MAVPTVIKWSDTGAPALTRTASSLISVLDYCLPQRGWVKEFSGDYKAVFRAAAPVWFSRVTLQGPVTEPDDQFTIHVRGGDGN